MFLQKLENLLCEKKRHKVFQQVEVYFASSFQATANRFKNIFIWTTYKRENPPGLQACYTKVLNHFENNKKNITRKCNRY